MRTGDSGSGLRYVDRYYAERVTDDPLNENIHHLAETVAEHNKVLRRIMRRRRIAVVAQPLLVSVAMAMLGFLISGAVKRGDTGDIITGVLAALAVLGIWILIF